MPRRLSNQLPKNLPQLQNLIKRDAESYRDEFRQQLCHFSSLFQVFQLSPGEHNKNLEELVMFLAQVAKCYPDELADFPQKLIDVLKGHSTVLDADMRMSFCRALVLLRHKGLIELNHLVQLFFDLLKCQDKVLRKFLRDHIVNDVKNINLKRQDARVNSSMISLLASMLNDSHRLAAKTALDVMVELYRKNVWRDPRTVNIIANACLSDISKLMVTALKFFLGGDGGDADESGDENDEDEDDDVLPSVREVIMANRVNKKSRKRERFLQNIKKAHKKKKKKSSVDQFNFSALHLLHDPQTFAEKLFKKLASLKERFEVKLLFLDLISRLMGTHQLILLNFYSYVARFLTPHQREVVQLLQFAAQAAHELVPPDAVEPALRAIVNNFVTERNSAEVMAIGLNAVRELCNRCPLVMDSALLADLAAYKSYKDKGVMMAARSLIQLFRSTNPELLHKKDRGRPTEAMAEITSLKFGEASAQEFVAGAEVLSMAETQEPTTGSRSKASRKRKHSTDSSDWEDVIHSSEDEEGGDDDDDDDDEPEQEQEPKEGEGKVAVPVDRLEEKRQKAAQVTLSRILSDTDFKKIDAVQLRKQVQGFRKGNAKGAAPSEPVKKPTRDELVDLADIEMIYSKRRHDKEVRLASVMKGREGRDKFGARKGKLNEHASTTNKQKLKSKNFMMLKHKLKAKAKKSFVEKQRDLKRSLLRSKKFK